jgi:hypothetical protein
MRSQGVTISGRVPWGRKIHRNVTDIADKCVGNVARNAARVGRQVCIVADVADNICMDIRTVRRIGWPARDATTHQQHTTHQSHVFRRHEHPGIQINDAML